MVLHHDLSNNNALLNCSSGAKVTDFGMVKTAASNPHLTVAYCPSMMSYMSPKAVQEPPAYTMELNVFLWSVLHIQIITCNYIP